MKHKILKYVFFVMGIFVAGFIAFRPHYSYAGGFFIICYLGYLILASPLFYPAFYGNKWDYLRIILFTLLAAIITFGAVIISDKINHISGMEGLKLVFLQLEFLYFAPVLIFNTTAFCCPMKKTIKTVSPWSAFAIYAALSTYLLATVKPDYPDMLVLLSASVVLLPLLILSAIMTSRILSFSQHPETAGAPKSEKTAE